MDILLKRWKCLDDGDFIETEEDYRAHTGVHPDHKIVAEQPNLPTIKSGVNPGHSYVLETKSE